MISSFWIIGLVPNVRAFESGLRFNAHEARILFYCNHWRLFFCDQGSFLLTMDAKSCSEMGSNGRR
uniref:Uncharacterized protein n=1 Tax=Lotus japonicus TaxID=34305 RepID=I3T9I6_LOTJA|nr:unknown [Lotus japonicus]